MKPYRIGMVDSLVNALGLDRQMTLLRPAQATPNDLKKFHCDDYIEFLSHIVPETTNKYEDELKKYGLGGIDTPVFPGIWDFSTQISGGTIAGAVELNLRDSDIVVNWPGGLHHSEKGLASDLLVPSTTSFIG